MKKDEVALLTSWPNCCWHTFYPSQLKVTSFTGSRKTISRLCVINAGIKSPISKTSKLIIPCPSKLIIHMTHNNQTRIFLPQRGDKVTRNGSLSLNSRKTLSGDETTFGLLGWLWTHPTTQPHQETGFQTKWGMHSLEKSWQWLEPRRLK